MTMAISKPLVCGKCRKSLSWKFCNPAGEPPLCDSCGTPVLAHIFPAFFEALDSGTKAAAAIPREDANCFYHDDKRATEICGQCGRLLCSVCDVIIHAQHICPGCIESNRNNSKLTRFQSRRMMHDNIALLLAFAPLVLGWTGILAAPAAIVYSIVRWRAPGSLLPRTRIRFVFAILLAIISMTVVGFVIVGMIAS